MKLISYMKYGLNDQNNRQIWAQSFILLMELYHQTIVRPVQSSTSLTAHLIPINLRDEKDKQKQLLIAKTTSIELYHHIQPKQHSGKEQLKPFHREELFSIICAVDTIEYSDEDIKKELVLVSLSNGKYQLIEWMPESSRFSLKDQGYIFSNPDDVESGLCKPTPGHYIVVNRQAKLVMIATTIWEFRIYQITLGIQGLRLNSLLHYKQPMEVTSICMFLQAGKNNTLFYTLRMGMDDGQKTTKVYRLYRKDNLFQEEAILLNDKTAHLLMIKDEGFVVFAKENIYYYRQNRLSEIKLDPKYFGIFSCFFIRQISEAKDYFVINEQGHLFNIAFDKLGNGTLVYVQRIFPAIRIIMLDKNTFFAITQRQDHYIFNFSGHYRVSQKQKILKTKQQLTRQEILNPKYQNFKEIQIIQSIFNSRMIRDMKVAKLQKSLNKQIIITGGRPGHKKGFFSVYKYGLKINQYLTINFNPPVGAWCLKKYKNDTYHSYIIFSFSSKKTSSYSFEKDMLSHTNQLKIEESELTLHINRFYDNSIVQVTGTKIRHIQKETYNKDTYIKGKIIKSLCVTEGKQLFTLFVGGFMEYYELNSNGELKMITELKLDRQANMLDYSPPEMIEGKPFSRILVIGKTDYHIGIFTINNKGLQLVNTRNVKYSIQSLSILSINANFQIILGTNLGKMVKLNISKYGQILGSAEQTQVSEKNAKFSKLKIMNKMNLIRTSPSPTLYYQFQEQNQENSLPLPSLDFITQLATPNSENKCVFFTYFENYLRFIEISGFNNLLQEFTKDIDLPGKKIVICNDRLGILSQNKERKEDSEKDSWVTIFCLYNPNKGYFPEKYLKFQNNEKCMSVCYIPRQQGKGYLCFGCVNQFQTYPTLKGTKPSIKVYSYEKDKDPLLSLLYVYYIDDLPTAMDIYNDKLLVGIGKKLVLYEIFNTKLISRAVKTDLNSMLSSIAVQGEKIVAAGVFHSFAIYRFNSLEKSFDYIGEDILPKFLSASHLLDGDYGVVAGADKFGNFFISKFNEKMKVQFQSATYSASRYNQFTDCNKLQPLVMFNIGEIVTSIQSGSLNEHKPQLAFYCTIDGRVGIFYPFDVEESKDLNLLRRLEEQLRKSNLVCASNHKAFRSFYHPQKGVIDGDFCKAFLSLNQTEKNRIANSIKINSKEISLFLTSLENKFM